MQVETYCKKTHEEVLEEQRRLEETAETRAVSRTELCKSLGLEIQAERQSADAALSGITAEMFFPKISFYEHNIWRNFLSRAYSKSKGNWKEYQYDTIPVKALEEISFAHSLGVFDDIQIWTPERNTDPAAIGVVNLQGNFVNNFLITRWGESLKPFEEIEKEVCSMVNFGYSGKGWMLTSKLREWIETYHKQLFQKSTKTRMFYYGLVSALNIRRRHCGQRMHNFIEFDTNPYTNIWVCSNCLHTETKAYYPDCGF